MVEEDDVKSEAFGLWRKPSATWISLKLDTSEDREAIEFRSEFVLEDGR
jgi:hypothetical protein